MLLWAFPAAVYLLVFVYYVIKANFDVAYRVLHPSGSAVDGIIYESAREPGHHAAVIFADPEHCGPRPDRKPFDPEQFLLFTSHEVVVPPTG